MAEAEDVVHVNSSLTDRRRSSVSDHINRIREANFKRQLTINRGSTNQRSSQNMKRGKALPKVNERKRNKLEPLEGSPVNESGSSFTARRRRSVVDHVNRIRKANSIGSSSKITAFAISTDALKQDYIHQPKISVSETKSGANAVKSPAFKVGNTIKDSAKEMKNAIQAEGTRARNENVKRIKKSSNPPGSQERSPVIDSGSSSTARRRRSVVDHINRIRKANSIGSSSEVSESEISPDSRKQDSIHQSKILKAETKSTTNAVKTPTIKKGFKRKDSKQIAKDIKNAIQGKRTWNRNKNVKIIKKSSKPPGSLERSPVIESESSLTTRRRCSVDDHINRIRKGNSIESSSEIAASEISLDSVERNSIHQPKISEVETKSSANAVKTPGIKKGNKSKYSAKGIKNEIQANRTRKRNENVKRIQKSSKPPGSLKGLPVIESGSSSIDRRRSSVVNHINRIRNANSVRLLNPNENKHRFKHKIIAKN